MEPNPPLEAIKSFLCLADGTGTSGQPAREQFAAIREAGYEVVINLALPTSPGLNYVHIPVNFDEPAVADVDRFFKAMQANEGRRIFVHCAANMRVSAFMYLYRRLKKNVPDAEALRDLHQIWIPNDTWAGLIEAVMNHRTGA